MTILTTSIETHQQPAVMSARTEARWLGYHRVLNHTHTYSGRSDHGGTVRPPESYIKLAQWTKRVGIDALGMGSPYTPASAANYRKYDRQDIETYYNPSFDHRSVCDEEEIQRMLNEVNGYANERTLFYLDNETPKAR